MGDSTFAHLTTALKVKTNFKRLKELRLYGTAASSSATDALRKVCSDRKITCCTERPTAD